MKINKKIFDSLTREPNEVQEFEGKTLEIFYMTEEEQTNFELDGRYSIWTSDGKNFRFLVNKDFYNYGTVKEFYVPSVNEKWINYILKISNFQRKFLYALMLPIMILYIALSVVSILFLKDYALYILIGMMVVIFVVNAVQSRIMRRRMEEENEQTQLEIQEILTVELYDQIAKDQIQFREMKNRERDAEYDNPALLSGKTDESVEEEVLETEKDEVEQIEEEDVNV